MLQNNFYFLAWLESLTAVIQKPGRKAYDIPKSYRPIALLNAIAKIYTALDDSAPGQIFCSIDNHDVVPRQIGELPVLPYIITTDFPHIWTRW